MLFRVVLWSNMLDYLLFFFTYRFKVKKTYLCAQLGVIKFYLFSPSLITDPFLSKT